YLRFTGARGTSFSLYWLQAKSLFHVTMNEKFRKVRTAKLCPNTPDNAQEKIRIAGPHPIPIAPQQSRRYPESQSRAAPSLEFKTKANSSPAVPQWPLIAEFKTKPNRPTTVPGDSSQLITF